MGTDGERRKEIGELRCSCCGPPRSGIELGTFTTDLSFDFGLTDSTLTQTVLYCCDDSDCRGTAQTLRLIHSAPVAAPGDLGRAPYYVTLAGMGTERARHRGESVQSERDVEKPALI